MPAPLRVLALCTYPVEAAATRYRLDQFRAPLQELGIKLEVRPFLTARTFATMYDRRRIVRTAFGVGVGMLKRSLDLLRAARFDVLFVQREAMLIGPPAIEWALVRLKRRPMVLDLDDPTYLAVPSPVYGRSATILKWPQKTQTLMDLARCVVCGSRNIASIALARGKTAVVLPTIVDVTKFHPGSARQEGDPVIGWIGTHSTFPYLEVLFPVLQRLATERRFRLLIVGSGRTVPVPGVDVESRNWSMEREVDDFREIDIGLYPLPQDSWAAGKSGFKAVQYLSMGIPHVASPVGAVCDIGVAGTTHLLASTHEDWYSSLRSLLDNRQRRIEMGNAARRYAEETFSIERHAATLASVFRGVI